MNSQPSSAIENGLTAQLMNRVTPMPRQYVPTCARDRKVDLQQHRMIISQIRPRRAG
jgi:hypothetical protein